MYKIIIQEEIKITQKELEETIEHYAKLSDKFCIGILGVILNKKGIEEEIRKLSETGKAILLMYHQYKEFEKEASKHKKKQ